MKIIRPSYEDEMVLAFLKAEVVTPDIQGIIERLLTGLGYTRALIDDADLGNAHENWARTECLSHSRGYRLNSFLFEGFPSGVSWHKVILSLEELGLVKYIDQEVWKKASCGTRLVSDGVRNLEGEGFPDNIRTQIKAIEAAVKRGHRFPELIVVGESEESELILLEGHKRATAYVRAAAFLPEGIEVIAGFSKDLERWTWY